MNLPYSAEQIEEIKEDLYNKVKEIRTREYTEPLESGHRQFVEVKLSAYAGRKSL